MPICEITVSKGLLTIDQKQSVVDRLTKILLEAEGFIVNPISKSICYVNFIESKSVYLGGKLSEKGKILIKIHVFSDAYSDEIKKGLFLNLTKVFIEEDSFTRDQNGQNVWCIIFPIETNNFGAGGMAATLEQTRQFVSSYTENN